MPKKRPKIMYVITKSNFGGAQHYVLNLAQFFAQDDNEVMVVCGGKGELYQRLKKKGIRVLSVPRLERDVRLGDFKLLLFFIKLFLRERPDVVHLNSTKVGVLGSLAGRLARVPRIVFTAHGWAFGEDRAQIYKKIIKFLSWLTVVLSHKTILVSKYDKNLMYGTKFTTDKMITIHIGLEDEHFYDQTSARKKISDAVLKKSGAKIETFNNITWVGTVAELHANKGLFYALEAIELLIKHMPNLQYIIMGDGELKSELEGYVNKKGLSNNIHFIGFVKNACLYLKAFDIFLFTSIKEGLPYAVLEAGLAELPVVATNVGGISEIINNNTGILVPAKNSNALYEGVKTFVNNRDKCAYTANRLRDHVIKNFSLDNMIQLTESVYNDA